MADTDEAQLDSTPEEQKDLNPLHNDEQASISSVDDHVSSSLGWTRLGTEPVVAAFDVGRLRRKLEFHLVQSWFEQEDCSTEILATETAFELGRRARLLNGSGAERQRIQIEITESISRLYAEDLEDFRAENRTAFLDELENDDELLNEPELINEFLKPIYQTLEFVDQLILTGLEERCRLAFELVDPARKPALNCGVLLCCLQSRGFHAGGA
jgi:hypothetical protein